MHRLSLIKILNALKASVPKAFRPARLFTQKIVPNVLTLSRKKEFRIASAACFMAVAIIAGFSLSSTNVTSSVSVGQSDAGTIVLPGAASDAEQLSLKETEKTKLDNKETAYYSYTPSISGAYAVQIKDGGNINCNILDANGNRVECTNESITESGTKTLTYDIQGNVNYTVAFSSDVEEQSEVAFSLNKTSRPSVAQGAGQMTVSVSGSGTVALDRADDISEITWESSDPSIVTVDGSGNIYGVAGGTATVTASGKDSEGYPFTIETEVSVRPADLDRDTVMLNLEGATKEGDAYLCANNTVKLLNLSETSTVSYTSSSSGLAVSGEYKGNPEDSTFTLLPKAEGNYTVTFCVDGIDIPLSVQVISASIQENECDLGSVLTIYNGESTSMQATGFPEGSQVTWSSSDPDVASVDASGNVTGMGFGDCTIIASCNGAEASYPVRVLSKGAVGAVRYAYDNYDSKYSQGRRMSDGYYDCSSFVWRGYDSVGSPFGGATAPTAASQAKWCVENGYMVYYGTVNTDDLLPGDLIYSCGGSNGRYKGIYHVDIYVGGRKSMTVHRTKNLPATLRNVMVARPYGTSITFLKGNMEDYSRLDLKWDKLSGATSYDLYRSTSEDGGFEKIATVDTNSYSDSDVEFGKTYYYKVKATWSGSTTYSGNMSNAYPVSMAYGSPGISVSADDTAQSLVWDTADVSGYHMFRSETEDGEYSQIAEIPAGQGSFTDSQAEGGKTYYYRICSYVERDGKTLAGDYSNTVPVTY